jgi:hypothetical protein
MRLIVSGLENAPVKFKHLWGRYPYGFKPWNHCIQCFVSRAATEIHPEMKDGAIDLKDHLFYLCGVGQERSHPDFAQKVTNVHLAVRPRKGSVASMGSVYGVTFTIEEAQAIPIQPLPDGFRGLKPVHTRCKNFQFGHQMFADDASGATAGEPVFALRDSWSSIPLAAAGSA